MGKSKDLASGAAYQDQTESDTRYVNTAGDTMTGALNVNGGSLSVNSTSEAVHRYLFLNTGATNDGHILFQRAGSPKYQISSDTSNNLFTWNYTKNGTSFRINADGSIIKPHQPSFSRRGQYGWQTKSSLDNIGSWYDGYDNTNMLNAGTGVATAPVAGKYMVSFLMYVNDTSTAAHYARPYVNGSLYKDAICYLSSGNANDNTSSATWFISLSANDTVQWYHLGDIYGYHTWWNMHLLG